MTSKHWVIIVPTLNRHPYLDDVNKFYQQFDCHIIIADSSATRYTGNLAANIEYLHLPGCGFVQKIREAFQRRPSQANYVLLAADDDFIFPRAVNECIKFLETNPDFATAQGLYMTFDPKKRFKPSPTYAKTLNREITQESSVERLYAIWKDYFQLYYAVYRVPVFQRVLDFGEKIINETTGLNLFEAIMSSVSIIHGKHKVLPLLYGIRESNPKSAGSSHPKIWELKGTEHLNAHYRVYLNHMATELQSHCQQPMDNCINHVSTAMDSYLAQYSPRKRPLWKRVYDRLNRELGFQQKDKRLDHIGLICRHEDAKFHEISIVSQIIANSRRLSTAKSF